MNEVIEAVELDDKTTAKRQWWFQLTIADGLMLLIMAAAIIMRFIDLGKIPLSPDEAQAALASWQLWQPDNEAMVIISPIYFSLTSLIVQVLGYSDAVMRLIPAVFGVGVVILPWFLRHRVGTTGVLVLSFLLAISPMNSAVSRTAGGETTAIFAILLMIIGWLRYQETGENRWLNTLFAAIGLGLTSAPLFYSGLVTLVIAWKVQSFIGSPLFDDENQKRPDLVDFRNAVIFGFAIFLASSSLLLWYPGGIGATAGIFAQWLSQFSLRGDLNKLIDPILAIGRYEIILLFPGIAAVIWATAKNKPSATLAIYWMVTTLILILLQRGHIGNVVLITIPGYLLFAVFTNGVIDPRLSRSAWGLAGTVTLLGMIVFVNLARFSKVVIFQPEQLSNIWIALLGFTVLLVAIYFVGTWDFDASYQGALLGVLALFTFYYWGTGWWLSHYAANDPRERWVETGTADDIRILVDVVEDISHQATGDDFGLEIFTTVDSPILKWYLREFDNMSGGTVLPVNADTAVIISPAGSSFTLENDYSGADFGLTRNEILTTANPNQTTFLDTLRWWIFHDSNIVTDEEKIILWWRSNLSSAVN